MNGNFDHIIDVTEADFEYQVLAFSQQVPVIVEFWAVWCAPCRVLSPLLERLAEEANGDFRLARLNVDENPNLSKHYKVRSIPAVKAFVDGQLIDEFSGILTESQVHAFIRKLVPDINALTLEKGNSLLAERQTQQAELTFRELLGNDPGSPEALLGLSKSLLFQGRSLEAVEILEHFPVSSLMSSAETLQPLAALLSGESDLPPDENDPLAAAFQRASLLIKRGNYPAALDGLLDILRADKRYRMGQAHQVILGLFELLGNNHTLTIEYQRELANILF